MKPSKATDGDCHVASPCWVALRLNPSAVRATSTPSTEHSNVDDVRRQDRRSPASGTSDADVSMAGEPSALLRTCCSVYGPPDDRPNRQ